MENIYRVYVLEHDHLVVNEDERLIKLILTQNDLQRIFSFKLCRKFTLKKKGWHVDKILRTRCENTFKFSKQS